VISAGQPTDKRTVHSVFITHPGGNAAVHRQPFLKALEQL
jgi:hypothetical protein